VSCYNFKLDSGCNLGKASVEKRMNNQFVKYKNTRVYLQLYIPQDHKDYIC